MFRKMYCLADSSNFNCSRRPNRDYGLFIFFPQKFKRPKSPATSEAKWVADPEACPVPTPQTTRTTSTPTTERGEARTGRGGGDGRRRRARRHHLQGLHHPAQQALAHRRRQGPLRRHVVHPHRSSPFPSPHPPDPSFSFDPVVAPAPRLIQGCLDAAAGDSRHSSTGWNAAAGFVFAGGPRVDRETLGTIFYDICSCADREDLGITRG